MRDPEQPRLTLCSDPQCRERFVRSHLEHPPSLWCPQCGHALDIHRPDVILPGRLNLDCWCAACAGQVCRWTMRS